MNRIEAIRREDLAVVCPYCQTELPEVFFRKPLGAFGIGQGYVFFCPSCRKVLGTAVQWYAFPHRT